MEASFCLFWLRSKQASLSGGVAQPSHEWLGDSGQRGRAAAPDENSDCPDAAAGSSAVLHCSAPPRYNLRRCRGPGRGRAAAGSRATSQSQAGTLRVTPGRPGNPFAARPHGAGGGRPPPSRPVRSPPGQTPLHRPPGPQRRGSSGAAKRPGRAAPEGRAGAPRRRGYKREGAGGGRKWAVLLLPELLFGVWASRGAFSGGPRCRPQ